MRWVLPLVLAGLPWLGFRSLLVAGRRWRAACLVAAWGVLLAFVLGALEWHYPGLCGRLFPGAAGYANDMLAWVRTGSGCEGTLSCFVPQHLLHLAAFTGLTLATGGLGGLVLAAVLFGWMGAYTGQLAGAAGNGWALVAGWHPWAVLRVVGFILIGVAGSEPLLLRDRRAPASNARWWTVGFGFCLADVLAKWVLAEPWRVTVLAPLLR